MIETKCELRVVVTSVGGLETSHTYSWESAESDDVEGMTKTIVEQICAALTTSDGMLSLWSGDGLAFYNKKHVVKVELAASPWSMLSDLDLGGLVYRYINQYTLPPETTP